MILGSHVRFNKEQLLGATKEAISYNANAFMIYTGAPQNTIRSEINIDVLSAAKKLMNERGLFEGIVHLPSKALFILKTTFRNTKVSE